MTHRQAVPSRRAVRSLGTESSPTRADEGGFGAHPTLTIPHACRALRSKVLVQ